MIRRHALFIMLALAVPLTVRAEVIPVALSAVGTSQTLNFSKFATYVMVCNDSTTDRMWVRIFTTSDTLAPATAALPSIPIPVASSTQPSCFSVPHNSKNSDKGFNRMTYIAASGKTPTGYVVYE